MKLSIVVIAYNMAREVPRTIRSLLPPLQKDIAVEDYEIILVDNGSTRPFSEAACRQWGGNVTIHHMTPPHPSPVAAINTGLAIASGELIGVWIDGARLASPGVLARARQAAQLHTSRPVIATHNFMLGPDSQRLSALQGYDQAHENRLLASINWAADPYRLFDVACFAHSSSGGWFRPLIESNALFMTAAHWRELGGFDEAFAVAGGGLANADMWVRACTSSNSQVIVLLGEGTFHQIHGGVGTTASDEDGRRFLDQYAQIRGHSFERPEINPIYFGTVRPTALPSIAWSAGRFPGPVWHGPMAIAERRGVAGRPFASGIGMGAMGLVERGVQATRYKGAPLVKSPFDIALYTQLTSDLRPGTIFEIGDGGVSGSWLADIQAAQGIPARVVSVAPGPHCGELDSRVQRFQAEIPDLVGHLTPEMMQNLPRPFLVIESGRHRYEEVSAVLNYFDETLISGDYIVVERGIMSELPGAENLFYRDGPNRAVADFLAKRAEAYEIDIAWCDFYGHNVTGAPNGWLRRR